MPCVAPHDVVLMLLQNELAPTAADANKYWEWLSGTSWATGPAAANRSQPLFVYGDEAQYTDYADKMLGVYMGCLLGNSTLVPVLSMFLCSCHVYTL